MKDDKVTVGDGFRFGIGFIIAQMICAVVTFIALGMLGFLGAMMSRGGI